MVEEIVGEILEGDEEAPVESLATTSPSCRAR